MRTLCVIMFVSCTLFPLGAQEDTGVYVTTQYNTSFRADDAITSERLAVIPHSTTLPAVGRSRDNAWVQVIYEAQTGWVAYSLIVWSGDFFGLPIIEDPLDLSPADVYVTTQGPSSLRVGPGRNFERITVIPAGTTLPAQSRTPNAGWFQVAYDGQIGWVSYSVLVWSGDVFALVVDLESTEYARRVSTIAITLIETPLYNAPPTPDTVSVGSIPPETIVEYVRGEQIIYDGRTYWIPALSYLDVLRSYRSDAPSFFTSYASIYTPLIAPLREEITAGTTQLRDIETIWRTIESGNTVSCNNIPNLIMRRSILLEAAVTQLVLYEPVEAALVIATDSTNTAITLFSDACDRADPFLNRGYVENALDEVDNARYHFNLATALLNSLE